MLTAPDYLTETLHVKISDECCFSKLSQPRKKRRRAWLTVHLAVWRSKVAFHICEVLHHWHCKQPREDRGRGEEMKARRVQQTSIRHQRRSSVEYLCVTHTHRGVVVSCAAQHCVCAKQRVFVEPDLTSNVLLSAQSHLYCWAKTSTTAGGDSVHPRPIDTRLPTCTQQCVTRIVCAFLQSNTTSKIDVLKCSSGSWLCRSAASFWGVKHYPPGLTGVGQMLVPSQ